MTDISTLSTAYKSPSAVANYLIDKARKDGIDMTPMKLIKMIYIAYGWSIAAKNIKLFDEEIEAWKYGPVIPSIYHEFKHFGGQPIIDCYSQEYDPFQDEIARTPRVGREDKDISEILDIVWDLYKDKSATALMRMTHQKDTPWDKVWNQEKKRMNGVISPESIQTYYETLINELVQDAA